MKAFHPLANLLACLLLAMLAACSTEAQDSPSGNNAAAPNQGSRTDAPVMRERRAALSREYAAFRSGQVSGVSYTLSLQLDQSSDAFTGQVEIAFELAEGNDAPVTVDYDSGDVLAVRLNGEPAEYDYERWFVTLPPEQFRAGANTLSIDYRRPYATDGAGLHKFTDPQNGEIYLYTNFEPYDANRLFPHFDQPDLKAPMKLDVLAPASWQVIANTRERAIETADDGRRHWDFPASAPISSYIYAMHAGPFALWENAAGDIPLRLFARNAIAPYVKPDDWFTPTRQSFAFFQDYFQLDYPFGKYDQVIVPDFNAGAMENVGAVTFNERYVSRGEKTTAQRRGLANTIAHEMAHMWFGDLVTMQWWNGLWLNESFATYMANLELERASDFDNTWDAFYSGTKQWAYETDQLVTTHPIELEVPTTADAFTNFDGITYGKGASVLKQLPYFLGEENFRRGVGNYLREYAYGNTSLDDFVSQLGMAADQDMDRWQRQWLYQSGVNTIEPRFTCDQGELRSLDLRQYVPAERTAHKVLRSQRTQVGLYRSGDAGMELIEAIPLTYSGSLTRVPEAAGLPCPDLVFPNEDDWAYVKILLDPASLATLQEHINDFSDPTTRIMLWVSLWDQVRDARMPLTAFVAFALANIGPERDPNIVSQVSGNLGAAFSLFSSIDADSRQFQAYKADIELFLWEQLDAAEPGSDLQKIWFDSFVARAHGEEALNYLAGLLRGERQVAGMNVDQDRRWDLVITLNRYLHGDYQALLEAERERDNSDQGNNMALAAEAVRPLPEMKQEWLDLILERPDTYKLATLRTVMSYLFTPEQDVLLEQHAERILGAIPDLDANGDQGYIDAYVSTMGAATCTPDSVARLAEANGEFEDLQPLIVKSFLIWHQEDQRCVEIGRVMAAE